MLLHEHVLYSVTDFAGALSVNKGSIYQSLPGVQYGPKLGRRVPAPIRLGRSLRWSGRQIIDFVASLQEAAVELKPVMTLAASRNDPLHPPKRRPGRPRKTPLGDDNRPGGVA